MKEESRLAVLFQETPGPGLKARRYNGQKKFPPELQVERAGLSRPVGHDGNFHR